MPLPSVVVAHQQGVGLSAYKRQKTSHEARIDGSYALRQVWDKTGRINRRVWTVWYTGGVTPIRIYDVQPSTVRSEVAADLAAWRAGV